MEYNYLVINDNDALREIFCEALQGDAEVLSARDGQEALALLDDQHVDMVICDVNMPVMNGIEFCKQALEKDRNFASRVIMITGDSSNEITEFCRYYGITLLDLPVTITTLRTTVKALLGKNRSRRQIKQAGSVFEAKRKTFPEGGLPAEIRTSWSVGARNTAAKLDRERRLFKRKPFLHHVSISKVPIKAEQVITGSILEISLRGIRFTIPKETVLSISADQTNSEFSLSFTLPGNMLPIIVKCLPKWVNETPAEVQIGAVFEDIVFPFRKALEEYLN